MSTTRRQFLKKSAGFTAGAFGFPYVIASAAMGNRTALPASERITVAHIGAGGQGGGLIKGFTALKECQSVAVCDPFQNRREQRAQFINKIYADRLSQTEYRACDTYKDFRDVLDREDIDAVVIATPDHWHVPIALAAVRKGKDVYVEKPLGLSIEQNKALRTAVRQYGRVFQYGTQQRSFEGHCVFGCELIRNGYLGKIREIHVQAPTGGTGGSTQPAPLPEGFDYDLWLGPAPYRPYTQDRCTPHGSYFVYDNSIGYLGGWGAHPLDIMHWAFPQIPVEYEGTGVFPAEGLFDAITQWNIRGRFADGTTFFFSDAKFDETTFIGEAGQIRISRRSIEANPESLLTIQFQRHDNRLKQQPHHQLNFLQAVKTRCSPVSDIDSAVQSDFISHLSDIAIRTGSKILWDPQKEEILNHPIATRLMSRPMRSPWTL